MSRVYTVSRLSIVTLLVTLLVLPIFCFVASAAEEAPISAGKTYTFEVKPPLKKYPDPEGTKLTDGILAEDSKYTNPKWVGFWSTEPFAINIDLGSKMPIHKLRSHHMAGTAGITWPTKIYILVSDDNIEWSLPLEMAIEDANPGAATMQWIEWDNLNLEGRWVQIAYQPPREGRNIFISEIELY